MINVYLFKNSNANVSELYFLEKYDTVSFIFVYTHEGNY